MKQPDYTITYYQPDFEQYFAAIRYLDERKFTFRAGKRRLIVGYGWKKLSPRNVEYIKLKFTYIRTVDNKPLYALVFYTKSDPDKGSIFVAEKDMPFQFRPLNMYGVAEPRTVSRIENAIPADAQFLDQFCDPFEDDDVLN